MFPEFTIMPRLLRSSSDFEAVAAEWMSIWGHKSVRQAPAGRDGGIDVESDDAIAQVKAWMSPVGSPEIQQLRGAAFDGRMALFFSLSEYTTAAVRFANLARVALFRFSGYAGEVEPANELAAEHLTRQWQLKFSLQHRYDLPLHQIIHRHINDIIRDTGFFILQVKAVKNRFVQAMSVHDGALIVESVGPIWAEPVLSPTQIDRLVTLGWPSKLLDDNYRIEISDTGLNQIEEAIKLLAVTLADIHGVIDNNCISITSG